jgi:hypothetical protein
MSTRVFIDSFSGLLADLKKKDRTPENALRALAKDGRVSCFDRSEFSWLNSLVENLVQREFISEDKSEQYPWQRFSLTEKGKEFLENSQ